MTSRYVTVLAAASGRRATDTSDQLGGAAKRLSELPTSAAEVMAIVDWRSGLGSSWIIAINSQGSIQTVAVRSHRAVCKAMIHIEHRWNWSSEGSITDEIVSH
jgi:hypothetical protein